ncbi:MAG: DMP19 family protein [Prevotella sp.]|uniref:DMP19 family protein n=1 Tax=Prevotella sp. TaxID=59823 RepID=UPI002A2BB2FF|nr:DMP19 family protein [Prevotella sp.]MDD7318676.1 DMP19 family protein [Prevotellaceae bacterium]MDY4019368.1 DMP19 family protein [Prevotella sp.]
MIEVEVRDVDLQEAASKGIDEFVQVFVDAIYKSIGGELTLETMQELNSDQITLLAYIVLRDEVMNGGFVQLIHNGYGSFIFKNPFAKAVKAWGMKDLCRMVYDVHSLYVKYNDEIEKDCTDDEFMAMFEKYPEFDDYDDEFVEKEEQWTADIARYIDSNIENFAKIV